MHHLLPNTQPLQKNPATAEIMSKTRDPGRPLVLFKNRMNNFRKNEIIEKQLGFFCLFKKHQSFSSFRMLRVACSISI